MSALAEDHDGNWQLIYYSEINFKHIQVKSRFDELTNDSESATVIPLRSVSFESPKDELIPPSIRY